MSVPYRIPFAISRYPQQVHHLQNHPELDSLSGVEIGVSASALPPAFLDGVVGAVPAPAFAPSLTGGVSVRTGRPAALAEGGGGLKLDARPLA